MSYNRDHNNRKGAAARAAEAFDKETEEDDAPPPTLPDFINFGNLISDPPPEPPLLIGGNDPAEPKKNALVHKGDKVMLGAESKAGKTWWMLQQMLCIAAGMPFLGHQTAKAGLVLYINFELRPWAFARRVAAVSRALGMVDGQGRTPKDATPPNFKAWNLRGVKGGYDIKNVAAVALDRLRDHEVAAVALDPLYKSYGGKEENSATDMAAVLEEMERFSEALQAAFFISSHFAKGDSASKAQIDRISGSGVIARDPDSIVTLSKIKDAGPNLYVWESTLRNMACPEPRAVEFEYPIWKLRPDISVTGKGYSLEELAGILPTDPDAGLSVNDWFKAANEQGISVHKTQFLKLKDQCLEKRLIRVQVGPRNAHICSRISMTDARTSPKP
jgi:hypothetical protein